MREVMANAVWGKPRDGHSAQKLALMGDVIAALENAGWELNRKGTREALADLAWSAWSPDRHGENSPHCPWCDASKDDGHSESCRLAAAIDTQQGDGPMTEGA